MSNIRPWHPAVPAYEPAPLGILDTRILSVPLYHYRQHDGSPKGFDYDPIVEYLDERKLKVKLASSPKDATSLELRYEYSAVLQRFTTLFEGTTGNDHYNYIASVHNELLRYGIKYKLFLDRVQNPVYLPDTNATIRTRGDVHYYYDDSNILSLLPDDQLKKMSETVETVMIDSQKKPKPKRRKTNTYIPIGARLTEAESVRIFGGTDPKSPHIIHSPLIQDMLPAILKYCTLNDRQSAFMLVSVNKAMRQVFFQDTTCYPLRGGNILLSNQLTIYEWMINRATERSRGQLIFNEKLKIPMLNRIHPDAYWLVRRPKTEPIETPFDTLSKVADDWANAFMISAPTGTGKTLSMLMAAETTIQAEEYLYKLINSHGHVLRHRAFDLVTQDMSINLDRARDYFAQKGHPRNKVLIVAPPTVGCSVYRKEYHKFFPGRTDMKLFYGSEFVPGEDYSKYKYIIVSASAFIKSESIMAELKRIHDFRMVIVDEFHYGNKNMVTFIQNQISYDTLFLMSATPPDGSCSGKDYSGEPSTPLNRYMRLMGFDHDIGAGYELLNNNLSYLTLTCDSENIRSINRYRCHTRVYPNIKERQLIDGFEALERIKKHPLGQKLHIDRVFTLGNGTNFNYYNEKTGMGRDILSIIKEKKRVLIFVSSERDTMPLSCFLSDFLPKVQLYRIIRSNDQTRKLIEKFDEDDSEMIVMIATPLVAGMGLNLHHKFSTMIVIQYDRFGVVPLKQCKGRLNRIGQTQIPDIYLFREDNECNVNNVLQRYIDQLMIEFLRPRLKTNERIAAAMIYRCRHDNIHPEHYCTCLTTMFFDKNIGPYDKRNDMNTLIAGVSRELDDYQGDYYMPYDHTSQYFATVDEKSPFFVRPYFIIVDAPKRSRNNIWFINFLFRYMMIGEITIDNIDKFSIYPDAISVETYIEEIFDHYNTNDYLMITLFAHTIKSVLPNEIAKWLLAKIEALPIV